MELFYYSITGLLTALVAMGATRYFVDHQWAVDEFNKLGFPEWLVYTLGVAKFAGLAVIWLVKSNTIKQWAYAGFTFNFLMAIGAHLAAGDGEAIGGGIALVLLAGSYFFYQRVAKAA